MKFVETKINIDLSAPFDATHYQISENDCAGYAQFFIIWWKMKNGNWLFFDDSCHSWHRDNPTDIGFIPIKIEFERKENVDVCDYEIESYDVLSDVIRIHIRKGLTEKEAMEFKSLGAKIRRIEGTEREVNDE